MTPNEVKKENASVAVEGGPFLDIEELLEDNFIVTPVALKRYMLALRKSDRESLRQAVEGMKIECGNHEGGVECYGYDEAHNQTLDDVLKLLADKE